MSKKKAGRPKMAAKDKKKTIGVRLTPEAMAALKKESKIAKLTITEFVELAVRKLANAFDKRRREANK